MHQIVLEKGLLKTTSWMNLLRNYSKRWVIITDDQVKHLCAINLQHLLENQGFETFLLSIPCGEHHKSRTCKEMIEDHMLAKGFGRDTGILAVGGGVVTDLAGFVAATYCRGIPFVSIPTTLLAMIDASIGGKVAVNTPYAKNMVGAFHPAKAICLDSEILNTLPPSEWLNGLAEMMKYGFIYESNILDQLQATTVTDDLIALCCEIKQKIVGNDPYETGLRRILNYGHTVGHAIETASCYQVPHGEAIAIGMIAEGYLSHQLGFLSAHECKHIEQLFIAQGFSLKMPASVQEKDLYNCMMIDKKAVLNRPRFVLLEKIGKTKSFEGAYCTLVEEAQILEMVTWILSHFHKKDL